MASNNFSAVIFLATSGREFAFLGTFLACHPPTMPTITKRDLALRITDQLGEQGYDVTQNAVADILQCLIHEIGESLARGDRVAMRKFGTFEVREMKAKVGRNPKNPGKDVRIPARAVVKFKPGNELKDKVAATLPIIRENQS